MAVLPPVRNRGLLLRQVPEDRERAADDIGQIRAPRCRLGPLATVTVGHDLHRPHLNRLRDGLLFGRIGFLGELVAQGFHLGVVGPAEPAFLRPAGVEPGGQDRVKDIGTGPRGHKDVPTAVGRFILFGPTGD